MLYKTIVLHLLEARPEMYEQLRSTRTLLPTLDRLATELKTSHEAWKRSLSLTRPASDASQIASEASEMALKELEQRLLPESPPNDNKPLSLDAAMAFIGRHTPPA